MAWWIGILETGADPPPYKKWTEEDERKLNDLKSADIDIEDTALGRYKANRKRDLMNSIDDLSKEERQSLRARLLEVESKSSNQEMEVSNQETEAETSTDEVAELGEQLSSMKSPSQAEQASRSGMIRREGSSLTALFDKEAQGCICLWKNDNTTCLPVPPDKYSKCNGPVHRICQGAGEVARGWTKEGEMVLYCPSCHPNSRAV